jgi:predicted ATPase
VRRCFIAGFLLVPAFLGSATLLKAPTLADVANLDSFKARFNVDAGTPRLVLLLSPT